METKPIPSGPVDRLVGRLRRHAEIAASLGADSCYILNEAADEIERLEERHEVRRNDDGTLDEIVGIGAFQLEQMSAGHWFLSLGPVDVHLTTSRGSIKAIFEID